MSLHLFIISGSPFAWKVQLALEHKGLSYHLDVLSASNKDHKSPTYLKLNPHGKVPTLVHDEFVVFESDAIVGYIEEAFPGPSLWPADVQQRATARRIVSEVSSYIAPAGRTIFQALMGKAQDAEAIAESRATVATILASYVPLVADGFISGATSGAADYALYPYIALLKRFDSKNPSEGLGALIPGEINAWCGRIEALPHFMDTYPPHWKE